MRLRRRQLYAGIVAVRELDPEPLQCGQLSATAAPSTSRINTPSAWSKPQHDAVHRKGRTPNLNRRRIKSFRGGLTLCSRKVCQAGPDYEVMKGPDHVEIGEAEGIVGVHDGCRDELRAGWRIATEQR